MATKLYEETLNLLINCRDKLDRLALALLDKETLEEYEIDFLIGKEPNVQSRLMLPDTLVNGV